MCVIKIRCRNIFYHLFELFWMNWVNWRIAESKWFLNLTSNRHRRTIKIPIWHIVLNSLHFLYFDTNIQHFICGAYRYLAKTEKKNWLDYRVPIFVENMVIYGVYIVSKSGGLIFNHDHNIPKIETEKVFTYPIDLKLEYDAKKVAVAFGQKDGINSWVSQPH